MQRFAIVKSTRSEPYIKSATAAGCSNDRRPPYPHATTPSLPQGQAATRFIVTASAEATFAYRRRDFARRRTVGARGSTMSKIVHSITHVRLEIHGRAKKAMSPILVRFLQQTNDHEPEWTLYHDVSRLADQAG